MSSNSAMGNPDCLWRKKMDMNEFLQGENGHQEPPKSKPDSLSPLLVTPFTVCSEFSFFRGVKSITFDLLILSYASTAFIWFICENCLRIGKPYSLLWKLMQPTDLHWATPLHTSRKYDPISVLLGPESVDHETVTYYTIFCICSRSKKE